MRTQRERPRHADHELAPTLMIATLAIVLVVAIMLMRFRSRRSTHHAMEG